MLVLFLLPPHVDFLGNFPNFLGDEVIKRFDERSRLWSAPTMLDIGWFEGRQLNSSINKLRTGRSRRNVAHSFRADHLMFCPVDDLPTRFENLVRRLHIFC